MSQSFEVPQTSRRRILADSILSPDAIAQLRVQRAELSKRCREIFQRVRPELIEKHYNWFIAIDPDKENYLIAPSLEDLVQKVRSQYKDGEVKLTTFRLNETGICGRI